MLGKVLLYAVSQADRLSEAEYSLFESVAARRSKNRAGTFIKREDACRSLVSEALLRYAVFKHTGLYLGDEALSSDDTSIECHRHNDTISNRKFSLLNISHNYTCAVCTNTNNRIETIFMKPLQLKHSLENIEIWK